MGEPDGFNGRFLLDMAGKNETDDMGMTLLDLGQQLGAVHFRHFHVRNDDIHGIIIKDCQSLLRAGRKGHIPDITHFTQRPL